MPGPELDRQVRGSPLSGIKVLVVEDQMLIAMDLEALLAVNGITDTVTSGSSEDALRVLKSFVPDVAVLDVNLRVGTSISVADELSSRNIPFVFATGYDDKSWLPPALSAAPVVRKPYDSDELIQAIAGVLRRE